MGAARAEVAVRADAELGEGPTWDESGHRLIWVDILASRVHTFAPDTGRRTVLATEQHVGAAKPCVTGGLVVNLRDGIGRYAADGSFRWLHHDPVPGRRGNEAMVAPDGALWAGTMFYDDRPGGGNVTRIAPDGSATEQLTAVTVSNGTGWSPDGHRMYYVDTPTLRVDVLDFDPDTQQAGNRRPFVTVPPGSGSPDGLCVDADGCLWVAFWDGGAVRRYTPDGKLDRTLELPVRRPTSCAFGGAGLRDLYITSARTGLGDPPGPDGSLLVVPGIGQGRQEAPFGG
ncbi:L-arabinolactonase [Streptomyces sp. YIM 130001]|uniref:SMP-30/gluconolactonase/LRE family protein n=1 Tax=Streptomyces sp. YIM 130001 TaxID=2259644 RepID=UPI000E657DAC|nr:SMP-30/gluconolactonase/LRE family protein [Streptomyces sp. YIM 130001]RII12305.1 L-arabinolactonase [Streptomyces sp. YIM 130001]